MSYEVMNIVEHEVKLQWCYLRTFIHSFSVLSYNPRDICRGGLMITVLYMVRVVMVIHVSLWLLMAPCYCVLLWSLYCVLLLSYCVLWCLIVSCCGAVIVSYGVSLWRLNIVTSYGSLLWCHVNVFCHGVLPYHCVFLWCFLMVSYHDVFS